MPHVLLLHEDFVVQPPAPARHCVWLARWLRFGCQMWRLLSFLLAFGWRLAWSWNAFAGALGLGRVEVLDP